LSERPNPQTLSSDESSLNVTSLRPYRPLDPRDNRYDTRTGDKIVTAAQVTAALSTARTPSPPATVTRSTNQSGVTSESVTSGATQSGAAGDGLRGNSTVEQQGTQQPTGSSIEEPNNDASLGNTGSSFA
jgi:hypothetical protein